jgi:hypothetical protein
METFTVEDDRLDKRSAFQNISYFMALILNFFQMIFVTFFVAYIINRTTVGFTYFRPSGNPCEPYYNLTFPRWFYLIWVTVSIVDVKMGYGVGHKIWKRIAIVFSGAAAFAHIVVFAICIFFFITTCNAPGSGAFGNICNSREFCGVASAIADPANQCQYINPTGKPLAGTLGLDELTWDTDFVLFFIFQGLYTAFAIMKFVAGALLSGAAEALYGGISGAVSGAKRVFNTLDNARTQANEAKIQELKQEESDVMNEISKSKKKNPGLMALKSQLAKQVRALTSSSITIVKNLASEMKFFDVFTPITAFLYVVAIFMEIFITLGLIAWFGWFQQNVDSVREIWRETSPISGFSEYFPQQNSANLIFYIILGFNIIPISFMTFLGDIYSNIGSILASTFGFILNIGLLGYTVVFHMRQCNTNGVAHNPCTNLRGVYMAFATNPANDVAYGATCVAPFAPLPGPNYPWDPSYIYFFVMILCLVIYYAYAFVLSIALEWTFRTRIKAAGKRPDPAFVEEIANLNDEVDALSSDAQYGGQIISESSVSRLQKKFDGIIKSSENSKYNNNDTESHEITRKHKTMFGDISDFTKFILFRTEPEYFVLPKNKKE